MQQTSRENMFTLREKKKKINTHSSAYFSVMV